MRTLPTKDDNPHCLTCGEMQTSVACEEYFGPTNVQTGQIRWNPKRQLGGLPICFLCLDIAHQYVLQMKGGDE